MKAAVMEAVRKPLVVKDVQDPSCPANGVIIRSEAEGVCRSDWHAWSGDWGWIGLVPPLPLVMGHEFCGVVEEVGKDSRNFKKGDRVLVPFSQGDGVCEYCRAGQSHICANPMLPGFSYWGGYGHYVGVPNADANLVAMPDDVGFEEGASMGCRFMTSYHGVVDRAQVRPGEWVAVHGCGGIGLSAIHVAAAIGANVIAVDLDDAKLELAKKVGAQYVVNGKKTDAVAAIMDITKGGAHVGVDALGVKATCQNSILSLRKQGRSLQIGLTSAAEKGEVALPIDRMVTMELSLIASLGMPANRYASMLQMVNAKKLDPKSMITETISLGGASAVLEQMTTFQNVGVSIINKYTA
jgi:D-arabinose 1-dehydrogenase-like Zn-dependent alcohol dehydrogenase